MAGQVGKGKHEGDPSGRIVSGVRRSLVSLWRKDLTWGAKITGETSTDLSRGGGVLSWKHQFHHTSSCVIFLFNGTQNPEPRNKIGIVTN